MVWPKGKDDKMDEQEKQDAIENAESLIKRNGGGLGKKPKTVSITRPGIKALGAVDCLVNYGGYARR